MLRIALSVVAFCLLGLLTHGEAAIQQTGSSMTNEDVVDLVEAGLAEDTIIAAIRQTVDPAFDVDAAALIRLKQSGVSDAILQELLRIVPARRAVTDPTASSNGSSAIPSGSYPPGVYIQVRDGSGLVPMEPNVFSQQKAERGGAIASALTFGLYRAKAKAVIPGAKAGLQIADRQPTFAFIFPDHSTGSSDVFSGWLSSASSPNQFTLVQLFEETNSRELIIGEHSVWGSDTGTRSQDTVALNIERLEPGRYKVTLQEPLTAGEYAFFYSAALTTRGPTGEPFSFGSGGRLFDFGVE